MQKQVKDGQEQLLKKITSLFQQLDVSYVITCSISIVFYGRRRASHDVDFAVEEKVEDIDKMKKAFQYLFDSTGGGFGLFLPLRLSVTATRMRFLKASSLILSPS